MRYLWLAARSLDPRRVRRERESRRASFTDKELFARTDEFNVAAERQWRTMADDLDRRGHLLRKPFASLAESSGMLYRVGLALELLDLGVGHTVLDLGAGSGWLSLVLNRLQCRTIAVDVSPTALALGREAFARDAHGRPELGPQFLPYDGRTLPLAVESVDRIICFDAFHHVPNQDEILAEMYRVLRTGGRVVMVEPGEGHAHEDESVFDAEQYGVLENDLIFEDLLDRTRRAGFDRVLVKPYPDAPVVTLEGGEHLRLLEGDHSVLPLHLMVANMRQFYIAAFLKGEPQIDSRNPKTLRAAIEIEGPCRLTGSAGQTVPLRVVIENVGDTTWLATEGSAGGYVCLGGHLHDGEGQLLRLGYFTHPLPRDLRQGERVTVEALVPLPPDPGAYLLRVDLVDAGIAWFSQRGSPVVEVALDVS